MADTLGGCKPHLTIIDGYGFVFRAYHSLPPLTRPSDQTPIGAVYGFLSMLLKLLDNEKLQYIAVAFDSGKKSFRHEDYAEYKANRPPPPDDLIPQFPMLRELTEIFHIPVVEAPGYEADDLIATYTKLARSQGMDVHIISSDKDLMQLIDDHVHLVDPIKNKIIGEAEVIEKFGVPPKQLRDVLALMGDSSDNIPGIPGIGQKTAAQLIQQFGSVAGLYQHLDDIPPSKRRESLINHKDDALLSYRLVTLCENSPLPLPLTSCKLGEVQQEAVIHYLEQQGFKSLISRARKVFHLEELPSTAPATVIPTPTIASRKRTVTTITSQALLNECVYSITESGMVAILCLSNPKTHQVTELLFCSPNQQLWKLPLPESTPSDLFASQSASQLPFTTIVQHLKLLWENPTIIKIGYDLKALLRYTLEGQLQTLCSSHDLQLMSYILWGGSVSHALHDIASRLSLETNDGATIEDDSFLCLVLFPLMHQQLVLQHDTIIYERVERPLIPVITKMEKKGVLIDVPTLRHLSTEFATHMTTLEQDVMQLSGISFNIASPKQLGEVLFDNLGLPGGTKLKSGAYSTSADVLEDLVTAGHTIAEKILAYRQYAKLKSTYTDTLPLEIHPKTHRIHTTFSMVGTTTGRLSSSKPNVQNIPIRTEAGNQIRKAFIAPPGKMLISADYSQIELRLLAHMANIPQLKEAFAEGQDIHTATASQMFHVPLQEVDSTLRRKAKAINFGIIYGISAFGLSKQLGISRKEAGDFIDLYFTKYPAIQTYMQTCKDFLASHGYVKTLWGRKCFIPDIYTKNPAAKSFAERAAINAPLQGTAADIIKHAMIQLDAKLTAIYPDASLILQIHDELIVETPESQVQEVAALTKQIMEHTAHLTLPLIVDVGIGKSWFDTA